MRTLLIVFAIALLPLVPDCAAGTAPRLPPRKMPVRIRSNQDNDQVPDKDQGKLPVFRKNVTVVNVLFTVKDKHGALDPEP